MVLLPFSKYFHDSATTWKEISDKICLESLIIYFPQNYQIRWCRIRILNYKCSVALFHLCQRLTIKCFHVWNQILKWTHYGTTEAWNTPQMHDDGPYWCGSNLCVCTVLSILIAPCMLSLNGKYIMKNLLHILHFFSTNLWICQCPSSPTFLWKSLHTGWEASYLSSDVFKFESQRNLVSQPPPPESSLWFRRLSLAELSLVELLGGTPLVWIVQALVQAGPPHGLGQVRGGRRINSPAPKRILHMSWARDLEQKVRNKRIHHLCSTWIL